MSRATLAKLVFALIVLGLFCSLSAYAMGRYTSHNLQAVTHHAQYGMMRRCQNDFKCLVAWAEEDNHANK